MRESGGTAVVVFGSVATGEADVLSDKDVLLVGEQSSVLDARRVFLERRGWSCTCYSWSRLEAMAGHGSLFVHHLRSEGRVLEDSEGRFAEAVRSASVRSSYRATMESSLNLLKLLEFIPSGRLGWGWAADVLAVSVRSVLVAALADDGEFAFSTGSISEAARRRGWIAGDVVGVINALRTAKRSFRRRREVGVDALKGVLPHLKILRHLTGDDFAIRVGRSTTLLDAVHNRGAFGWYAWSRLIEGAVLSLHPVEEATRQFRMRRRDLLKVVSSPGEYGWWFAGRPQEVLYKLSALLDVSRVD